MWPFPGGGPTLWLALYLLTFALHAVFVSYVLAGTAYALIQSVRDRADPIAERVRDRLPFMLGCGITAGVAPLLFIQLIYQRRFYTANLILGPRWGAVVPALIAGFYALYLAKAAARMRWRRAALAGALGCFAFVAWSWTELHLLMRDEPVWREMYAAGARVYANASVAPRLLLWFGAAAMLFPAVAIWWERGAERRRLAAIAVGGMIVVLAAAVWLVSDGATAEGSARGWHYLLAAALAALLGAWIWTWVRPDGPGAQVVAAATAAAVVAGAVVREAPRLAVLEPPRASALEASGAPVFFATLVVGALAISWVWRAIRPASIAGGDASLSSSSSSSSSSGGAPPTG